MNLRNQVMTDRKVTKFEIGMIVTKNYPSIELISLKHGYVHRIKNINNSKLIFKNITVL